MSNLRRHILASALMVVAPLAATAQPLAVPQHAPEAPLVVVSFADVNAFWNAYTQTSLKTHVDQLLALPEVANESGYQEMQAEIDKASAEAGLSMKPSDLLSKTIKGMDIYLTPTLEATDEPGVVFSIKTDSPDSAAKLAGWMTQKAAEVEPPYVWNDPTAEVTPTPAPTPTPLPATTSEIAGFKVTAVESEDGDLPFNIAQKGDVIVLANDMALLEKSLTGAGAATMTADPAFQSVYSPLAAQNGQMFVYVSAEAMKQFALEANPDLDPTTLESQPPVAAVGRMNGTKFEMTTRSLVPPNADPTISQLMAISPGPIASIVRFAAPQALMAMGANVLEGELLYDYAVEQAEKTNPEGAAELQSQLAAIDEAMGMSLRDDVLAAFGPVGAFHLNGIRYGGGFDVEVDTLAALQVRDEEKAELVMSTLKAALLDSLNAQLEEGATPIEEQTISYNGVEISALPVSPTPMPIPVQPGFYSARAGDTQLIALTEAGIKAAIDRASGAAAGGNELVARSGLAASETSAVNSFSWVDFGGFAEAFAKAIPTIVGFSGGDASMQSNMELVAAMIADLGTVSATQTNDPQGQTGRVVWALK